VLLKKFYTSRKETIENPRLVVGTRTGELMKKEAAVKRFLQSNNQKEFDMMGLRILNTGRRH